MTMTTCPKCEGNRFIDAFKGIERGVCFRCSGSGEVPVKLSEVYQDSDRDLIKKVYWMVSCSDEVVLSLPFEKLESIRNFSHQFIGGKYDWVFGLYCSKFEPVFQTKQSEMYDAMPKPF